MIPDEEEQVENILDFNLKENIVLLHFLRNDNKPSYAAQVERELPKSKIYVGWPEGTGPATITRRSAKKVCEGLVRAGVMESMLGETKRQKNLSKHYFLKSDLKSFRRIFGRVAPYFSGYLVSTKYAQEIIEKQLIEDLEKTYDTEFDKETKANIVVTLFLSTKAVELALDRLVLPPTEYPDEPEKRKKEVNGILLHIFQSALLTDIVKTGLAWRRGKLDEIDFEITTRIRKGDVRASITSRMKFESDLEQDILSELRVETS